MNFDQYEDPRPEQVELAKAVALLLDVLIDDEGKPRDLADRKGREALIRMISQLPKEIIMKLSEVDRQLLNDTMVEMKKTQTAIKEWFWWIIGTMALASVVISSEVVMMLR